MILYFILVPQQKIVYHKKRKTMFNILCIFTMKQKIYYHKTIFPFDLYLKQKTIYETVISSWHWIHDCIMMKYFHGVWKFYYKAKHTKK